MKRKINEKSSFIECCKQYGEKKIFTFHKEDGTVEHLTGSMLFEKIKVIGSALQKKLSPQKKVIMLFPQGLDYICSLYACMYANLVAVPIPIADLSQKELVIEKTAPICKDSQAECIITDSGTKALLKENESFKNIDILDIGELSKGTVSLKSRARAQKTSDTAILLYTSGSTSQPKGAMLSLGALLSQASKGAAQWEIDQNSRIVSWMPQFHSFGLVFNILAPLLQGAYSVILPTSSFVRNPEFWFRRIDEYKATHSGAPNFAFDLCCTAIDINDVKELSLTSLKAVICGGEPVNRATFESFSSKFKALGFKKNSFCSHYGMSEIGSVTTKKPGTFLRFLSIDIESLTMGKVKISSKKDKCKPVTSCGELISNDSVLIVKPDNMQLCSADEIGEVWVSSSSLASGYHNRDEETKQLFSKAPDRLNDETYLRTGDLGFIHDNNLYIVGREKEVIIIHGKNHHPVDIEWTIKKNITDLTLPVTVFSTEVNNQEKVVVIQEVEAALAEMDYKEKTQAILFSVLETHGLEIHEINLVEAGSIPKTGSGKLQRKACRSAYISRQLPVLYQYKHGAAKAEKPANMSVTANKKIVEILIKDVFSVVSGIGADKLGAESLFSEMGLDSIKYVQAAQKIEEAFNIEFAPIMLFKHLSLGRLAEYLAEQIEEDKLEIISGNDPRQTQLDFHIKDKETEIAVIGMSCNFPGAATDLDKFWSNIINGKDCITAISESRPEILAEYEKYYGDLSDSFPHWGGFIENTDKFDAPFFGISPLEAESMDPQQRKLLELTWSVIEDGGYNPQALSGQNIGLFIGVHNNDFAELVIKQPKLMDTYGAFLDSGLHMSLIAHRASRWYDFHGPSEVINTACSSSLVALHHAIESIYRGESSMAIAGGINLIFSSRTYRASYKAGMSSKEGHCKTFDQDADGFVRAEGYGAVLLKPLSQAVRDKDTIYGVIKGVTINHDGKSNSLRAPNLNAQKQLIKTAYKEVGLPVQTISYIETHGTGTPLGDPIEFQALQEAFDELNPDMPRANCGLGAVKTNIGHCESAAGIAGFIKIMLSMKHKKLPGILHFKRLNPYIKLKTSPFHIIDQTQDWKRLKDSDGTELPYRAGLSSFGFGGANAHVIMEEYISKDTKASLNNSINDESVLIPISAKNKESLMENIKQLSKFLKSSENIKLNIRDIAYTLQTGRAAMDERVVFCVSSIQELIQKLDDYQQKKEHIDNCWFGRVKQSKDAEDLLKKEQEYNKLIEQYAVNDSLDKLAKYWVEGIKLDWDTIYNGEKPRRINLPTYQFAKTRYWIPEDNNSLCEAVVNNKKSETNTPQAQINRELRFVKKHWEYDMPEASRKFNNTIAVLAAEDTRELAEKLAENCSKVELLYIENLESQLQKPEHQWKSYDGLIDITGCGMKDTQSMSWILWLQQLIEQGNKENMLLLCVTRGLEAYENKEINLAGASRAGLYRMLQNEYSHLASRHMDLASDCNNDIAVDLIMQELSINSSDNEVCYRNKKRYKAYLDDLQTSTQESRSLSFSEQEVLWITGGTRGLGYLCAEHFVRKYGVRKLVLTGREALPPRELWSSYTNQNTSIARKIHGIEALEAQGVQVKVLSVSLTDEAAIKESLEEVNSTMGAVGGIIHCAGIDNLENPAFIRKTIDEINTITEPKIKGLETLYNCFKQEPLKLFVLFSSVSAIIPSLASGHSDYAMANAYMDYFAAAKAESCPIVSIQWPNWKEAGMGEVKSKPYEQAGLLSHSNDEGLQMLDHILSNNIGPVVLPAMVNMDIWTPKQLLQRKNQEMPKKIQDNVNINTKSVQKADMFNQEGLLPTIQAWLIELFAKELRMDPAKVDIEISFQDYGVDSVLLTQITRAINKLIKVDLDPSIILEYSSISLLTTWLFENHTQALSEALGSINIDNKILENNNVTEPAATEPKAEKPQSSYTNCTNTSNDIAIVGLACRFPGGETLEDYWKLIAEGRCAISTVPENRWGYSNNFYAGLLDNITSFDPKYFHIPEEDAKAMDPQALVLMEECLKLWYNAGYTQQEVKGKSVGVYIGARSQYQPGETELNNSRNPVVVMGQNYLAANISQYFDLRGPSVVLDTACSSALVSMNMAIQAINSGEIDSAVVGGVSLLNTDKTHQIFDQRGILSKEPSFHIFDKRAKGVVLGEGVGMVLIKTLNKALEDKDKIYAVIKGLAVNNDGRTAGPATPNLQAQKEVLQKALTKSGKKADQISYIEVNGSGTEVTDLLELKAIQAVYNSNTTKWALGSIKPNIGHPLCAEGIASFIKVVLMLEHRKLAPFLSGKEPMTHYDIQTSPFYFCRELKEWSTPRAAAINCFADGGTNVHMILEAWEETNQSNRKPLPPPALEKYNVRPTKATETNNNTPKKSNWWTKL